MGKSTKGRFAVDAMTDLALHARSGPVALAQISVRLGVSLSYLEQLFARLRRNGLVEATRGPGGGYMLARRPHDITVSDIVGAVDDAPEQAEDDGPMASGLWAELEAVMHRHMATITLQSLIAGQAIEDQPLPAPRRIGGLSPVTPVRTNAPNSVFAFGQSFAR
jgi:Rrf2 family transcriptional regulator, iron-sulfur cluster assembly transcription factor